MFQVAKSVKSRQYDKLSFHCFLIDEQLKGQRIVKTWEDNGPYFDGKTMDLTHYICTAGLWYYTSFSNTNNIYINLSPIVFSANTKC